MGDIWSIEGGFRFGENLGFLVLCLCMDWADTDRRVDDMRMDGMGCWYKVTIGIERGCLAFERRRYQLESFG